MAIRVKFINDKNKEINSLIFPPISKVFIVSYDRHADTINMENQNLRYYIELRVKRMNIFRAIAFFYGSSLSISIFSFFAIAM